MRTILVTGAAGFIGANFVRAALAVGDRVIALDRLTYAGCRESLDDAIPDGRDPDALIFVEGDIGDSALVAQLLRDHRPDAIVNLAAETHVDRSIDSPRPFVDTNVVGTTVLLEEARRFLAETGASNDFRFLHVSTDEVFGSLGEDGLFSETTPYAPNSPYAASKAAADHFVRAYGRTYGLPILITNCSNNYGPFQFPEKLIPLMILNGIEGRPLPIYGDGGNVRDWLFVQDHCEAILAVLDRGRPGESYNIGGDSERTNVAVVDAICDQLEQRLPAADNERLRAAGVTHYQDLKTFVADRPGHDRRYAIDAGKLRTELGWSTRHGFSAAIADTVDWYVNQRDWCRRVQERADYGRERLGRRDG